MTNTNENGRSMVEMLGVLAIIGVLSVMGIAGYTQAMKKYRINETVAEINMGAMLCGTGQGLGGWTPDHLTLDNTVGCMGNGEFRWKGYKDQGITTAMITEVLKGVTAQGDGGKYTIIS